MRVLYEGERLMIQWGHDYHNLLRPSQYNWVEYTLVNVRLEDDKRFGKLDLDLALLGFHISFSWIYSSEKHLEECERLMKIASSSKWVEWKEGDDK